MIGRKIISYLDSATDVVSLNTCKDHLNAIRTDQDLLIEMYLTAAIERCSNYLGYSIRRAYVDYFFDDNKLSDNKTVLPLPTKVINIIEAYYQSANNTETALSGSDYYYAAQGQHVPTVTIINTPSTFADYGYQYRVRVEEGFYVDNDGSGMNDGDIIPTDIISAILLTLTHLYENRTDVNVVKMYSLEKGAEYLLNPYQITQVL